MRCGEIDKEESDHCMVFSQENMQFHMPSLLTLLVFDFLQQLRAIALWSINNINNDKNSIVGCNKNKITNAATADDDDGNADGDNDYDSNMMALNRAVPDVCSLLTVSQRVHSHDNRAICVNHEQHVSSDS